MMEESKSGTIAIAERGAAQLAGNFYPHIIRPSHYTGVREIGPAHNSQGEHRVLWVYPSLAEIATANPAWLWNFAGLATTPKLTIARFCDWAIDVWQRAGSLGIRPVSLEARIPIERFDLIAVWVENALQAARIPSLLSRIVPASEPRPRVAVLCPGNWVPRFAIGNVDYVLPLKGSWFPGSLLDDLLIGSPTRTEVLHDDSPVITDDASFDQWWSTKDEGQFYAANQFDETPQIVEYFGRRALSACIATRTTPGDPRAPFRDPDQVAADGELAFRKTGCESLLFCDPLQRAHPEWRSILTAINRRLQLRHMRIETDPLTLEQFKTDFETFHPLHMQPELALRTPIETDPESIEATLRLALGRGWRCVRLQVEFDAPDSLPAALPELTQLARSIAKHSRSYPDKRYVFIQLESSWSYPASLRWIEYSDEQLASLEEEFRKFSERLPRAITVNRLKLRERRAEAILSAAGPEIWRQLESVAPIDATRDDEQSETWHLWLKSHGISADMSFATTSTMVRPDPTDEVVLPKVPDLPRAVVARQESHDDARYGRRSSPSVSGRSLAPAPKRRIRIKWAKTDRLRFTSHLEMARAFERAVRRAGLPIEYSEGFHPRMKLAFGPPLPLGMTSECEYLDITLEMAATDHHLDAFIAALPSGIEILGHGLYPGKGISLTELINSADYEAAIDLPLAKLEGDVRDALAVGTVTLPTDDHRSVNLHEHVLNLTIDDADPLPVLNVSLRLGIPGALKPILVLQTIFGMTEEKARSVLFHRRRLGSIRGMETLDPLESD